MTGSESTGVARAGRRTTLSLVAVILVGGATHLGPMGRAQAPPDATLTLHRPGMLEHVCPAPQAAAGGGAAGGAGAAGGPPPTEAQLAFALQRQAYRELLFVYLAHLPEEADDVLLMPVEGVRVGQVANTYGAPRGGARSHQGQDIFAPRGTPVRSATSGIVYEISDRFTGGRGVMILGPGGVRYFYTHLEAYEAGLREGMAVTPDTVIGYVGNDGNASTTPPHLHFGAYWFDEVTCRHRAFDPLPLLRDR